MEIVLTIATILGGITAVWFVLDKIKEYKNTKKTKVSKKETQIKSEIGISKISGFWKNNTIDIDAKKYPKLKKLTFPAIELELMNSGSIATENIQIFFDYLFPKSMMYTIDLYSNSNKFLSGTNLKVTSFPPVEIKDINLMRLKIRLVWQDSKKQQEHEDYYYYEIGELKGNIFINPLNGTLDFHKESVFNTKNYELIAPKDFLFYRNDFIKNNYTN